MNKKLYSGLVLGVIISIVGCSGDSSGDSSGAYSANPSDWGQRIPDIISINYHVNPSNCNTDTFHPQIHNLAADPRVHNLTASVESNRVNCDTYGRTQTYREDNVEESRLNCWIIDMAELDPHSDALQYDTSCVYIYDMDND